MGIKGSVKRSVDGHIIHANIDTDIIVSEVGRVFRVCGARMRLQQMAILGFLLTRLESGLGCMQHPDQLFSDLLTSHHKWPFLASRC